MEEVKQLMTDLSTLPGKMTICPMTILCRGLEDGDVIMVKDAVFQDGEIAMIRKVDDFSDRAEFVQILGRKESARLGRNPLTAVWFWLRWKQWGAIEYHVRRDVGESGIREWGAGTAVAGLGLPYPANNGYIELKSVE